MKGVIDTLSPQLYVIKVVLKNLSDFVITLKCVSYESSKLKAVVT